MKEKRTRISNPENLVKAIEKWPNPMFDKRHGYYIYLLDGRARSNQSRINHIIKSSHDLKMRDLDLLPEGIGNYFAYKKDPIYRDTFNYYLIRKGKDRGFVKVSIQIDGKDSSKAWIKTIYVTYKVK